MADVRNMEQVYLDAIETEYAALGDLIARGGEAGAKAAALLHACTGRVVVIGMGKCGFVGRKIAATFASTGRPAVFVHPAEALHGDLGFIGPSDAALILSYSGETAEITALLPHLKHAGMPIVAITGRPESTLARQSDVIINTQVTREAGRINLAPTASTTAMLAAGDALAAVLMEYNQFTREDYALFHPGGALGQQLLCRVEALMHTGGAMPTAREDAMLRDALFQMTAKRLGAVFIVDANGALSGIVTDGDLRRILQREENPLSRPVGEVMTHNPRRIRQDMLAVDALRAMEDHMITVFPVLDASDALVGALHIHDIIRAGIR